MNDAARIRVLVVDDHEVLRLGVGAMLEHEPDFVLVGDAAGGEQAIEDYRRVSPDVVLMDLRMPGLGGVEAIERIRAEFPAARIVALSTYEGDTDIYRALEAGAQGYLFKDMLRTEMIDTLRAVCRGQRSIPPVVAARLAEHTPRVELTARELEVLEYMAKGLRNKEIAFAIGTAEGTVKVHITNIMVKLSAADRTDAVTIGLKRGIIHF